MKLLIDECSGPVLARWLKNEGYDVFSVYDEARGATDDEILEQAFSENRILITNDKDFGDKIFRDQNLHKGIVLLRLDDERSKNKIRVIQKLLENYSDELNNNFVVVMEHKIRIVRE